MLYYNIADAETLQLINLFIFLSIRLDLVNKDVLEKEEIGAKSDLLRYEVRKGFLEKRMECFKTFI